jgi:hypothetical protein
MKTSRLIIILIILLGTKMSLLAQTMSASATQVLYYSTMALETERLNHLISFVLSKDTAEHSKAVRIMQKQLDDMRRLKKYGIADSQMKLMIDSYVDIFDSALTIYGEYFRDDIMKDDSKTSEFTYEGKSYQVSKMRKKEFNKLVDELKELNK